MNRTLLIAGASIASLVAATITEASSLTLHPGDFGSTNVAGNGSSASGFPNSSWQSNATGANSKSELYIPIGSLFSSPVTVGDLDSVSYWTNKPGDSGSVDWTFLIYTAKQGSGDEASWYHTRLNSEPYFTQTSNANDPSNTWHEWSSNDPTNPMLFYDQGRSNSFGTYTDPTLADLTAGSVTWNGSGQSGASADYSGEGISLISLQTGSAWGNGFTGLVDGVTITLKNGDTATVNLEAAVVPLPKAAYAGLGLIAGIGVLGGLKRRQRKLA
jgi:hypothetical protein